MNAEASNAGFSLVEVLCAILILSVALVGLVQGLSTALTSNKESELQTGAALIAAGLIETLRAEGDLTDGSTDGDCSGALAIYRWKETISSAGIDGLHEVAVEIEHAKTGKLIYELRTLLFEPPTSTNPSETSRSKRPSSQRNRDSR
jgi:prepilin-type N-terminal cleavage/methylation domain-containing protein